MIIQGGSTVLPYPQTEIQKDQVECLIPHDRVLTLTVKYPKVLTVAMIKQREEQYGKLHPGLRVLSLTITVMASENN